MSTVKDGLGVAEMEGNVGGFVSDNGDHLGFSYAAAGQNLAAKFRKMRSLGIFGHREAADDFRAQGEGGIETACDDAVVALPNLVDGAIHAQ